MNRDPRLRGVRPADPIGYQQPTHAELYAEIARLDGEIERARELLKEFGSCDPYSGQPYDEVVNFLAGRRPPA